MCYIFLCLLSVVSSPTFTNKQTQVKSIANRLSGEFLQEKWCLDDAQNCCVMLFTFDAALQSKAAFLFPFSGQFLKEPFLNVLWNGKVLWRLNVLHGTIGAYIECTMWTLTWWSAHASRAPQFQAIQADQDGADDDVNSQHVWLPNNEIERQQHCGTCCNQIWSYVALALL